jgi:hypothetical protein
VKRRSVLAAVLVAAGCGCTGTLSERRSTMPMPPVLVDDIVMEFSSEGRVVLVGFQGLAGVYRLAVDRDDFTQQLGLLAGSYKSRHPVRLTLQGLIIERVSELPPAP